MGEKVPFVASPGILGRRANRFREACLEITKPTRVLLHSDGISPRFDLSDTLHLGAAEALESLFAPLRKSHDDASMLVMDIGVIED